MSLSREQINQFEVFGFLNLRQLFSADEMAQIAAAADEIWSQELGRSPVDTDVMSMSLFVESQPLLTQLLVIDDRLHRPLCQLMGKDLIWSGSEGNRGFKEGHTAHHWHADRPGSRELGYLRVKVMVYLDPMRREQGAFRVIPGSHLTGLHEHLQPMQQAHAETEPTFFGLDGSDVACYAVETDPGDVVLFNHNLFHAVYGKSGARRYIALKYAARPQTDEHLASLSHWSAYALKPNVTFATSENEKLRRMVAGLSDMAERAATLTYP